MVIQHNISAINAHRQLGINNKHTAGNLEKLSSGYRINRAGDDAAGLAISEKMRGQIRGLAMAETNCSNGISLIQTAEGGLQETHDILQRMRELAVQSANGTYQNETDRENIERELQALKSEIDRIASATHYNGINLLDGSLTSNGVKSTKVNAATDLGLTGAAALAIVGATNGSGTGSNAATFAATDAYEVVIARNDDGTYTVSGTITGDKGGTPTTFTLSGTYTSGTTVNLTVLNSGADDDSANLGADATITLTLTGLSGNLENGFKASGQVGAVVGAGDPSTAMTAPTDYYTAIVGAPLRFQIGANGTADQQVFLEVANMDTRNIGVMDANGLIVSGQSIADISVALQDDANAAIDVIDAAINWVSATRADLGALQNRLEHTVNNLGVTKENLTAAESTIRDVDMAKEMMEYTKNSILVQASQAMLAQANTLPQGVLQLLQ